MSDIETRLPEQSVKSAEKTKSAILSEKLLKIAGRSLRESDLRPPKCLEPQGKLSDPLVDGDWHEELNLPRARSVFQGIDGIAVTLLGVVFPAALMVLFALVTTKRFTLVLLNHPLETLAEIILLMSIPVLNWLVWSALCKGKSIFSRKVVTALGVAGGASICVSVISAAGLIAAANQQTGAAFEFANGLLSLTVISTLSAAVSAYLMYKIHAGRDLQESRRQVIACALMGVTASALTVGTAEFRPFSVRLAQKMAVSGVPKESQEGLRWLRLLNPERELRMECSDSRAAGLAGLFIPMKPKTQQQLYFALTGNPFSFADISNKDLSSMPDSYLSRHVVGEKIPGFVLTRSTLSGNVHPDSLSSTLNWTFVLKNDTWSPQEARAEFGLPPGAAVTGLTVWHKGEPEKAGFVASGKADAVMSMRTIGGDAPAMVTDLGHGRVLMHCYPVPQEEELKVRVTAVVPLKPETGSNASLSLPTLISSNFALDGEHRLRFRSTRKLQSALPQLTAELGPDKQELLSGVLTAAQLQDSNQNITVSCQSKPRTLAVLDRVATKLAFEEKRKQINELEQEAKNTNDAEKIVVMIDGSKGVQNQLDEIRNAVSAKHKDVKAQLHTVAIEPRYVIQKLQPLSVPAPKHLVVVLDGSESMEGFMKDVKVAMQQLPDNIPTTLIVAAEESAKVTRGNNKEAIISALNKVPFTGGQDNLKAVVQAAELAGETRGAAVLWIHGPQPVINQEIYDLTPYVAAPAFYELALGAGTDTYEFLKNHTEIGPFSPVPRNTTSIASDLTTFLKKWQPGSQDFAVSTAATTSKPQDSLIPSKEESEELLALYAHQEVDNLIAARKLQKAAVTAVNYELVSAVSSAIVGYTAPSSQQFDTGSTAAPINLQGTTNGTISPQGGDAIVVEGVNTAGTVRVNNLANLEAVLNIIANGAELMGLIAGAMMIINGFTSKAVVKLGETIAFGPKVRIAAGAAVIAMGLAVPGMINWLVSSARDANLFT